MKYLLLVAVSASLATAESHPSWWAYASPESTALVGIHWDNVRNSPFAAAIEVELSSIGPFAFPDLACLRKAREIVISSPDLLAAEAGSFPSATVREQAQHAGLHPTAYRKIPLWIPEQANGMGVAQISEQLLLVGTRKALVDAIDRSMVETGRQYSALLPRAARFSQTGDLWVVALRLPDPLASQFVPLDAQAWSFQGQVSVRDGLMVEASFDAGSSKAAAKVAADLLTQAPAFPPVARDLQASSEQSIVTIGLQVSQEDLAAALHPTPVPPGPPKPLVVAPPVVAKVSAPVTVPVAAKGLLPAPAPPQPPVAAPAPEPKPAKPKPEEPQVIRIIGLDEGVREIRIPQ